LVGCYVKGYVGVLRSDRVFRGFGLEFRKTALDNVKIFPETCVYLR